MVLAGSDGRPLDEAPQLGYAGHLDIRQEGARIALKRGLPVSISRHGFSPAVAEMALTLILGTLRRTSDYHAQMRGGTETWFQNLPADINLRERELTGRAVGMISASEVVVLCAAPNAGTRHLLGPDQIARFRENAVFVNVARAALVDTEALVERLGRGDLFAALDVFDREPLEKDSPLRVLPNAYLNPHRAGGVMASVRRILHDLIDDLEASLAGNSRKYALTEKMLPRLDS